MTDPNGTQVFISYARDDRSRVRPIVEKLETTGLGVAGPTSRRRLNVSRRYSRPTEARKGRLRFLV